MATHYDVLGVDPTASLEEIKAAFRVLALQLHPDKVNNNNNNNNNKQQSLSQQQPPPQSKVDFVRIQQAWDCLRANRGQYDEELARKARQTTSLEEAAIEIKISELQPTNKDNDDDDNILVYNCRCGDVVEVWPEDITDIGKESVLVECSGCSFVYSIGN